MLLIVANPKWLAILLKLLPIQMRIGAAILLLLCFVSCDSPDEEGEVDLSTIDSNTVNNEDTAPSILYLDNTRLDSFPMALDSVGPTIQADDTSYRKPGD